AVTRASFRLDGIDVSDRDARTALAGGASARALGPRQAARLRAHAAILRRIERQGWGDGPLPPVEVRRWHSALLNGLPAADPDDATARRLAHVCFRLSTPHRRLRPAVEEVARLHVDLLADPLVPSFNGILARLLLSAHLARVGLPPVRFDVERDREPPRDPAAFALRLKELIVASLDEVAAAVRG
ncbi:MAG TPA: hypothetical protein VF796_07285, partial [Humisphaera sp.]